MSWTLYFAAFFSYIFCAKPPPSLDFLLTAGVTVCNSFSTNIKVLKDPKVFKVLKVRSLRPMTKIVPL